MPKFMNAELEAIRDNLKCGHCSSIFKGSDSQAWKVKYEGRTVYCSSLCRSTAMRNMRIKPVPNRGPCKTCNKEFFSRTAKVYCSMDCYVKSEQFREMQSQYWQPSDEVKAKIVATLRKGKEVPCLECGGLFYQKRQTKSMKARKFCGTGCYRSYLAKRFDRWVANPEGMALPQCYDEFLDKEELACVVEGCEWKGQWLTLHMNQAHGVRAEEFKRAAGFNLSTGVIAKPLAQSLRGRENVGIALTPGAGLEIAKAILASGQNAGIKYRSLEGKEHAKKSRALSGPGPIRNCRGCGCEFQQSTLFGRAAYCTVACRDAAYAKARKVDRPHPRERNANGTFMRDAR